MARGGVHRARTRPDQARGATTGRRRRGQGQPPEGIRAAAGAQRARPHSLKWREIPASGLRDHATSAWYMRRPADQHGPEAIFLQTTYAILTTIGETCAARRLRPQHRSQSGRGYSICKEAHREIATRELWGAANCTAPIWGTSGRQVSTPGAVVRGAAPNPGLFPPQREVHSTALSRRRAWRAAFGRRVMAQLQ